VSEPFFLEPAEVVELHDEALLRHGGAPGIRDLGGLISAVTAPKNHRHYSSGDIYDLAAVLLIHLSRNHTFVDGNKRASAASAIAFLALNGILLETNEAILEDATLRAAQGHIEEDALAELLRSLPTLD
jgi:death-on-curing protein